MTSPAGESVVDLPRAMQRVGGDRALMNELVRIFLEDLPGRLDTLRRGIASGDGQAAGRVAHTMKGSLAVLEARRAYALTAELEMLCRGACLDPAAEVLGQLEQELVRVRGFFATTEWSNSMEGGR